MELGQGLLGGQETQRGISEGFSPGRTAQLKTELTKKRQKGLQGVERAGGEDMGQEGRGSGSLCRNLELSLQVTSQEKELALQSWGTSS